MTSGRDGREPELRPDGTRAGSAGWRPPADDEDVLRGSPPREPASPLRRVANRLGAYRAGHDGAAAGRLVGEVRGLATRSEQDPFRDADGKARLVWTFRLERYDEAGNRLPPVPVQMRGYSFDGALHDGDWVEVAAARWRPGTTLEVSEVRDLTTNTVVRVGKKSVWAWLGPLLFIVVMAIVLYAWVSPGSSGPPPGFPDMGMVPTFLPLELPSLSLPQG